MKFNISTAPISGLLYDFDKQAINTPTDLIAVYNKTFKKEQNVKIFFEKMPLANPYYVLNDGLKSCSALIEELLTMELLPEESQIAIANKEIAAKKLNTNLALLPKIFHDEGADELFALMMKNNILIENFRGGNRNTIPYDCEVDITISIYKDIQWEKAIEVIKAIAEKYNAKTNV